MNLLKLTIGMAVYDDYEGAYFTTQALRMYQNLTDTEILVVDNNPGSNQGGRLKNFIENHTPGRYIPYESVIGTSAPRNQVFLNARGRYAMCMDPHILLAPNSIAKIVHHIDNNLLIDGDLYSGPIVLDGLQNEYTHFDDVWGAEMWGKWGLAWQCPCLQPDCLKFSVQPGPDGKAAYRLLSPGNVPVKSCHICKKPLPVLDYAGHQKVLAESGYTLPSQKSSEPFEIPGQGLGLFLCKTDQWLGFNDHFRGFGGEELYIHEKFRQHGHKNWCIPWLRWVHRFNTPGNIRYPLTRWNKVRNYVIGFQELGLDLAPVKEHFVRPGMMSEASWQALVDNPIAMVQEPGCTSCGKKHETPPKEMLREEAYDLLVKTKRDLDKHMPKLKELAYLCGRITEFTRRRESSIAFLNGNAKIVTTYSGEANDEIIRGVQLRTPPGLVWILSESTSDDIETIHETDMLFIDSHKQTGEQLKKDLDKFAGQVRRFIVLHDTQLYGAKGEDGGPGLMGALTTFMKEHPNWSVIYHTNDQYGLTVLGCQEQDKPKLPATYQMAINFAKAKTAHMIAGSKAAPQELMDKRLMKCSVCPHRVEDRCTVCGCYIETKAAWLEQECPLGEWSENKLNLITLTPNVPTDEVTPSSSKEEVAGGSLSSPATHDKEES